MYQPTLGLPGDAPDARHPLPSRRPPHLVIAVLAAACCLAVAAVAGTQAYAGLTGAPIKAELSAAAAAAVADRWRDWPAGRIFPAGLGYSTSLRTQETARRAGIAPPAGCGARIVAALGSLARGDSCQAAIAATYVDQLQGVVFTIGVLVFATPGQAAAFSRGMPRVPGRMNGIRAQPFSGTASAAFSESARQADTAGHRGPYVVLTASGYADGRAAARTGQRDSAAFAPAAQLAAEVIGPLAAPVTVSCRDRAQWSC